MRIKISINRLRINQNVWMNNYTGIIVRIDNNYIHLKTDKGIILQRRDSESTIVKIETSISKLLDIKYY